MRHILRLAVAYILLSSCNSYKAKYPYSIGNFRPEVRSILEKIVQRGSTSSYYSEQLEKSCSLEELRSLFKCEHPVIRACTFPALIAKDPNNIETILFSSLDDTAIISYNRGEFGIPRVYCADYYLYSMKYNSKIEEQKIFDSLLLHHTNLENTFNELRDKDSLPEKYYTIVKSMALKTIDSESWYGNPNISSEYEKEDAILIALSKYKRKEDVEFILRHLNFNTETTWQIIQDNPDTAYFNVINDFFTQIIKSSEISETRLQLLFYGYRNLGKNFPSFLKALAKYKNEKSLKIFLKILKQKLYPIPSRRFSAETFKAELYDILIEENCSVYYNLIKQLKPSAETRDKHIVTIDSYSDSTTEPNLPYSKTHYW